MIVGAALDRMGASPDAWRIAPATGPAHLTLAHYAGPARRAEAAGFAFVTIPDTFRPELGGAESLSGRLDALLVACQLAVVTRTIGIFAAIDSTYTEPYNVANAVSTLDHVSHGRAGWIAQSSGGPDVQALFGGDDLDAKAIAQRFIDAVEVSRLLWDSWEDDAEIRDVASGRFVDRERMHHVDFVGSWRSVRGPSVVPRPPQGQPVIAVEHDGSTPLPTGVDLVFVRGDPALVAEVGAAALNGWAGERCRVVVDVVVDLTVDAPDGAPYALGRDHLARPDAWWSAIASGPAIDGVRFTPAHLADVDEIVDRMLPAAPIPSPVGETLRASFGLPRPENQFAASR